MGNRKNIESAPGLREVVLPEALTTSLASGHPWVYRDHVAREHISSGTWIRVRAGSYTAYGIWDAESQIAIRLFSIKGPADRAWVHARVQEAWDLRQPLRDAGVTGYRLIYGEGDGLPGVVVDLYADYAVLVSYSRSLGSLVPLVAEAVSAISGVKGVVRRTKTDDGNLLTPLLGEPPPDELVVAENGMLLTADLRRGQKTGLFFDHRENRAYVREMSAGREVLNLFSYTGGFSVAAALGGATAVTSVDIAAPAISASVENFRLNGLTTPHTALAEDVFPFLERLQKEGRQFDLIVCDPPSFAKNKEQLRAAEKAYRRLMALGLSLVRPGGLFCAASCTSQVGPAAFRHALVDAARKARVRLSIVRDAGHPIDHPVSIGHEEGRYLKFVAGRVLPRA